MSVTGAKSHLAEHYMYHMSHVALHPTSDCPDTLAELATIGRFACDISGVQIAASCF